MKPGPRSRPCPSGPVHLDLGHGQHRALLAGAADWRLALLLGGARLGVGASKPPRLFYGLVCPPIEAVLSQGKRSLQLQFTPQMTQ